MNTNTNENGGYVIASNETDAEVITGASTINSESGAVPASEADGEQKMKETNTADTRPSQALEPVRTEIPIDQIRADDSTHLRDHIDFAAVGEYAEAMKAGAVFPDIEVFGVNGQSFWLSDGRHRLEAVKKAGLTSVWARVYQGTQRDAILHSLEANIRHGVRMTNADKRKAVTILINDPEWRLWADNAIAEHCRVSTDLVKSVRAEYKRAHPE